MRNSKSASAAALHEYMSESIRRVNGEPMAPRYVPGLGRVVDDGAFPNETAWVSAARAAPVDAAAPVLASSLSTSLVAPRPRGDPTRL